MVYLSPQLMARIRQIESSGDPNAQTGSYKGLYQLSDSEFKRFGGQGSIFDPNENARIASMKLASEAAQVEKRLGRPLTDAEIYMVHQQGVGGAYEHITNPGRPAWQSMLATGEGQQKGEGWARKAIWGNVPDDVKSKYGSVDNMTSRDFLDMWQRKMGLPGSSSPFPAVDPNNPQAVIPQLSAAAPGTGATPALPYMNPQGLTLNSSPVPGWQGGVGLAGGTDMGQVASAPAASGGGLADTAKGLSQNKDFMAGLGDMQKALTPPKMSADATSISPMGAQPNMGNPQQAAQLLTQMLAMRKRPMGMTLTG